MTDFTIKQAHETLKEFSCEGAIVNERQEGGLHLTIHGQYFQVQARDNGVNISGPGIESNESCVTSEGELTKLVTSLFMADRGTAAPGQDFPDYCY